MPLTLSTTLLTNACTWVGNAHNAYIRLVGDEASQNSPFYWLEAVKSYIRGGNDLTTGITSGSAIAVAAQGSPNNTINITGGLITVNNQSVTVATNATYGSATIFTQNCTDGSALLAGQFYDVAVCADHLGALSVFRAQREERADSELRPDVPSGYCMLALVRINFTGGASAINTADITLGQVLTASVGSPNDPEARMFNDFDTGQTKLISRSAVKTELGFAITSLDKYVKAITASQGLGVAGAGLSFLQWAKTTHQTVTPFDFPPGFSEYIRALRSGKDPSQRLATITFTGSGTATIVDLKKVLGFQDKFELVCTNAGVTGGAVSTITITAQSTGATTAIVYTATVPAATPNGTIINFVATGTAALQLPIKGAAVLTALSASVVLGSQPPGTVLAKIYTALVVSSPITVSGGTNGDAFAVRNVGTL